ncbi:MAG TPA: serine hydrolase domain-containing protein [Candidatus Limnocylindrales bacterium]
MRGYRILWTVAVASTLATGFTVVARAEDTRAPLQRALDQLVAAGAPGALAEVTADGVTWRGTSGLAELGASRPVPAHGRFRIGSVTKAFVATVVMQLVAEGRLCLDDPVGRWLPGILPPGGERITLRHLLNHTSGLYNYTDELPLRDPARLMAIRFQTWNPWELLRLATAHPLLFEPGTRWRYSNTGDIVLGLIIEKVTGRPYGAEIERRIVRALGLNNTSTPSTATSLADPHAHGYLPLMDANGPRLVDITEFNPSAAWAAGEMVSTAADLNRFIGALLRGRLVDGHHLRAMTAVTSPAEDYGLGITLIHLPCGTVYGHDGDFPGYSTWTFATLDARRRITVSVTWGTGQPRDVSALLTGALCAA